MNKFYPTFIPVHLIIIRSIETISRVALAAPSASSRTDAVVHPVNFRSAPVWSVLPADLAAIHRSERMSSDTLAGGLNDAQINDDNKHDRTQPTASDMPAIGSMIDPSAGWIASTREAQNIAGLEPFVSLLEVDWILLMALYHPADEQKLLDRLHHHRFSMSDLNPRQSYLADHIDYDIKDQNTMISQNRIKRSDFRYTWIGCYGNISNYLTTLLPALDPTAQEIDHCLSVIWNISAEPASFTLDPTADFPLVTAIYDSSRQNQIFSRPLREYGEKYTGSVFTLLERMRHLVVGYPDFGLVARFETITLIGAEWGRKRALPADGYHSINLETDQSAITPTSVRINARSRAIISKHRELQARTLHFCSLSRILEAFHGHLAYCLAYLQRTNAYQTILSDPGQIDSTQIDIKEMRSAAHSSNDQTTLTPENERLDRFGDRDCSEDETHSCSNQKPGAGSDDHSSFSDRHNIDALGSRMTSLSGVDLLSHAAFMISAEDLRPDAPELTHQEAEEDVIPPSSEKLGTLLDEFNRGLAATHLDANRDADARETITPGVNPNLMRSMIEVVAIPNAELVQIPVQNDRTFLRSSHPGGYSPEEAAGSPSDYNIQAQLLNETHQSFEEIKTSAPDYLQAGRDFIQLSRTEAKVLDWNSRGLSALNSDLTQNQIIGAFLLSATSLLRREEQLTDDGSDRKKILPLHHALSLVGKNSAARRAG